LLNRKSARDHFASSISQFHTQVMDTGLQSGQTKGLFIKKIVAAAIEKKGDSITVSEKLAPVDPELQGQVGGAGRANGQAGSRFGKLPIQHGPATLSLNR
jgi:hypothetical protein